MIANDEGWHYVAGKTLPASLIGTTSKNNLESLRRICENKDFCKIVMPSEDIKIFEFGQYKKSEKASFIIYADLQYLKENTDWWKSNLENSSTTKGGKHIPSGFPMSTMSLFKSTDNKHDVHSSKDCMKKFRETLREHGMEIIKRWRNRIKI